jgi:hypothetical protein
VAQNEKHVIISEIKSALNQILYSLRYLIIIVRAISLKLFVVLTTTI